MGSEMPEVKAIIVQDGDGSRVVAKYFHTEEQSDKVFQADFEKKLAKKIRAAGSKVDAEILLLEGYTVAFRSGTEISISVVGGGDENELILVAVVDCIYDAIGALLRGPVERRSVLHNLELALLAIDEAVDGGIILEIDPHAIETRVLLRGAVPESISSYKEMTIGTVVEKLRDRTAKQFAKT